jgi:hypothetical protein
MEENEEIIKLGTVHGWVFKISLWAAPLFFVWTVNTILAHDRDIAVLKMQMTMQGLKGISQSVNVGQHDKAAAETATTARTWLTTKDVAAREKIDERTVLNYIEQGMIEPTPVKAGKAWQIAANFRIIPKDAETCGEIPQGP